MTTIHIFESIITGLIAGFICGLTGMGGGTIYVPVFYFMLGSIKKAIGTSLLVIFVSSLSAFISHMKARQVNFKIALFLIVSGVIGAQCGSFFIARIPDIMVKIFFVCLTIFLSFRMGKERINDTQICSTEFKIETVKFCLIGFVGGLVSGMGGVGGAIVLVPLLHLCVGLPIKICIGTGLSVVTFNSLSGFAGYLYHGLVEIQTGLVTGFVAIFSAMVGAKVSLRSDNRKLKKIFSLILFIAGLAILIKR
ncbi:MAG: sulfite exporter TauE/SafE family protein [bacterium]|nr:sulfite exporter TauE/SafE family protein [bacterium]